MDVSHVAGSVLISGEMTLTVNSDLNATSPQFTLNCISTGGPATTVTWTRDSELVAEGAETVLVDNSTARYIHSLIITTGGEYRCSVTNSKPSSATTSFKVKGFFKLNFIIASIQYPLLMYIAALPPTDVTAVQDGPTSIRVTWTPPSQLGDTTGYRISFTGGGSSDSVDVSGGLTNSYTLATGLMKESTYTVSIVSTSQHLPSTTVPVLGGPVILGELKMYVKTDSIPSLHSLVLPPRALAVVDIDSIKTTDSTITLSWTVPPDATESEVTWELSGQTRRRAVRQDNDMTSGRLSKDQNSYTISGLRSDTSYDITVTVFNPAGNKSVTVIITAEG